MSTSRRASATPCSGSVPVSPIISFTGCPSTPPASLMCWIAKLAEFTKSGPKGARAPVSGPSRAILNWPVGGGVSPSTGVSSAAGVSATSSSSSSQAAKARRTTSAAATIQSHLWRVNHCGMTCLLSLVGNPRANLTDSLPSSGVIVKRNVGNNFTYSP